MWGIPGVAHFVYLGQICQIPGVSSLTPGIFLKILRLLLSAEFLLHNYASHVNEKRKKSANNGDLSMGGGGGGKDLAKMLQDMETRKYPGYTPRKKTTG